MKITKATDYGFRKVICLCLNPEAPEYIHDDQTVHPLANVNGCDSQVCHYNHRIEEFIWTGEEMYTTTSKGHRRAKPPTELLDEIKPRLAAVPTPTQIAGLTGLTLET